MNSQHLNHITAARGTPVREVESDQAVYGYTNISFWIPSIQAWIPTQSPDKFLIIAEDLDTAKIEFWARWKTYCLNRFKLSYIQLENI